MLLFNNEYFFVVVVCQNNVAAVKLPVTLISYRFLCSFVKTPFLHPFCIQNLLKFFNEKF